MAYNFSLADEYRLITNERNTFLMLSCILYVFVKSDTMYPE